jgi:exopolysaccharide biosynthesis polyprenyl glycosylphosphotransferase
MNRPRVTQQTSSTLPLSAQGSSARGSARLSSVWQASFSRPLQWLLEGPGWTVLRPTVDLIMVCLATVLALGGLHATWDVTSLDAPLLALPLLVTALFHLRGLYRTRLRSLMLDAVVPVLSGVSVASMVVATAGIILNGHIPDQAAWVRGWAFALIGVGIGRMSLALAQRSARARRRVGKPVLIMGAGLVGSQVARRLENHPEYGLHPVGFLDEDPRSIAEVGGRDMPVLGTVDDVDAIVEQTGVKNLIVAFSSVADARVSRLIQRCQELGIEVSVVPRMFDTINNRVGYDNVGGLPLMSFQMVNPKGLQFAFKHIFDRLFAAALLLLLLPLIAVVAVAVRLSSPGPVLFRQRRMGRDDKVFDLYKFRSMSLGPESDFTENDAVAFGVLLGGDTAPGGVEGHDRRTLIGRILRRSSLDELPQLFNVLRGEMSIIGPRPERPEFVELFREDVTRYDDRHRVKAGITGWAQVHGLRGQTSLAERVEWDNYYIANWSLGLDLKILALTLVTLFRNAE